MGYSFIGPDGSLTFETITKAFSRRGMVSATVNSCILVAAVTAGACAIGIPLAWIVARTDTPGKLLVTLSAGVAFVIPTFVSVISWIFLAAPNSGYLNGLAIGIFGLCLGAVQHHELRRPRLHPRRWVYPLVFFAVITALNNVDASNEQAARILGAGQGGCAPP